MANKNAIHFLLEYTGNLWDDINEIFERITRSIFYCVLVHNMTEQIKQLQDMIDSSERIVFFGGAGVSTESNIPDFRSTDGLYNQEYAYPPETILSHSFYLKNKSEFYRFYRNKMIYPDALPNAAHQKLAQWEDEGKLLAIVTQNIDGLHQAAGSKNVYELHGSIHRNYCERCRTFYDSNFIMKSTDIPTCSCGGHVKPDVVLYEEGLDDATVRGAIQSIQNADMLIIGGTSLAVYPAAGMIDYFHGKHLVLINKGTTTRDAHADLVINGSIGEIFSQLR